MVLILTRCSKQYTSTKEKGHQSALLQIEVQVQIMRCFDVVLVNAQCEVCASKALYKVLAGRCVCFLDVTVHIVFEYQCTRWLNRMAVPTPMEGILSIFFSMIYQS